MTDASDADQGTDCEFVHADAREFDPVEAPGPDAFDAVFSNAALHWIPRADQDAVVERVAAALAPGGRFVAELGGRGNVAAIVAAGEDRLRPSRYDPESESWTADYRRLRVEAVALD